MASAKIQNIQIPGVTPTVLTKEDLEDPQLIKVNETFRQIITSLNVLIGAHGDIPFTKDLNLQGNSLQNVGQLSTTSTAKTASAGTGTLPANPEGFITMMVNGVAKKVPYYAS